MGYGVIAASSPLGPYVDRGSPLVQDAVGVIDASYFRDDDGRHYLLYYGVAFQNILGICVAVIA